MNSEKKVKTNIKRTKGDERTCTPRINIIDKTIGVDD